MWIRLFGISLLVLMGILVSMGTATAVPGDAPLIQTTAELTSTAAALQTSVAQTATSVAQTATALSVTQTAVAGLTQTAIALTPSATSTPTSTPATPTSTAFPAGLVDFQIFMSASPDAVGTGELLTYTITVINSSPAGATSPPTTVTDTLPGGVVLNSLGTSCTNSGSFSGGVITCQVPALGPNQSVTFSFTVQVTAGTGTVITNSAFVDPQNTLIETNEGNNVATTSTTVGGTAVPTATTGPSLTPTATPESAPPTPVPSATAVPATGTLWVRILTPQQTYSVTDDLLWIAQPGELYWVEGEEGGWLLVVWEGDTKEWSVWIRDQGVERLRLDRPAPPDAGQLWLVIFRPVQAYFLDMRPAWTAMPGEWYQVITREGGWVLGRWEGDPPDLVVWIQEGPQSELATLDAPH